MNTKATKSVHSGCLESSESGEILSTVLGSCVAICAYVPRLGIGAMNHYLLPEEGERSIVELLKKLKELGARRDEIIAKIVGGARVIGPSGVDIGYSNVEVARKILSKFKIHVAAEAVGGMAGRRVEFDSRSGVVNVHSIVQRTKVLIIDDSVPIQKMLTRALETSPNIEVVGVAGDTREADKIREKIRPDVITLDLHLPNESGVKYLERYMKCDPIPTIVVTSFNVHESTYVLKALELGAFDCFEKPRAKELAEFSAALLSRIEAAAKVSVDRLTTQWSAVRRAGHDHQFSHRAISRGLIAIGASTGGTEAIKAILKGLPAHIPPTLIVQHMPPVFTLSFAQRLSELVPFEVREAEHGELLREDTVYIAPGGRQMRVGDRNGQYVIEVTDDPPVNLFRPSVDYLFESLSKFSCQNLVAVLLTGMGCDGAQGLRVLRNNGAHTIAQDEKSCVVFGMPKAAIEIDAAVQICGLDSIAEALVAASNALVRKVA